MKERLLVVLLGLLVTTVTGNIYKKDLLDMVNDIVRDNDPSKVTKYKIDINDEGKIVPCTDKDPPFTLMWSPKDVKLGDTLVINFDMTPVVDLSSGNVEASLYLPDYPDPIYQFYQPFNCGLVHKVFPQICPFQKNKEVKISGFHFKLKPDLPLPGGTFIVKAKITNQKGELFACLQGTINIVEDYSYNYDYNY